MIPLLAVTSTNQLEAFKKLVSSIDYPIKTFSLLCNSYSFDYLIELRKLCKNDFINEFMISHCPYNMGCSTSWNYHMKMNTECDYWIFSGDDIVFSEGDLERANETAKINDVSFSSLPAKYSLFSLSKKCVKTVGLFDENIHPVNFEDDDYDRRMKMYPLTISRFKFNGSHYGSGTTHHLTNKNKEKFRQFYEMNRQYYESKVSRNDYSQGNFDFEERSKKNIRIK